MFKTRLLCSVIFTVFFGSTEAFAASELQQMRATLGEMQKLLQQQQVRIEQLEKQTSERRPTALTAAESDAKPLAQSALAAPATVATIAASPAPAAPAPAPNPTATPSEAPQPRLPPPSLATFYGKLDLFAEANWGGSTGSRLAMESGGMNGSRVGVKGASDLSGNVKLVYTLEAGFFGNNGRPAQSSGGNTRLFGRQAYVGVEGRLGKLTFGRQYSPYFLETIRFDSFENGYGSPTNDGNVKPGPTRYDSAVVYAAPKYQGFSGMGMVALGGKTGKSDENALGLSLNYTQGPLGLGVSYLNDNHNAYASQRTRFAFAGGSYQIGKVKIMGGLAGANISPDQGVASEWRSWFIGSRIDVTSSGQLWLNYGEGHTRDAPVSDRGLVYAAAWMETINLQTKAYLAYSRHLNDPAAAFAPSGTGAYDYYTVSPGDTANGLALGIQYTF
ncbi:MAG: porin [Azonexus sp.]|nr:porin [Azonexus sp.]